MTVKYDIPFLNTDDETAPAYAVLELVSQEALLIEGEQRLLKVERPTEDGSKLYVINGPVPVPADKRGLGTRSYGAAVLIDSSGGTPDTGDEWGPVSNSWKIKDDGSSFYVLGMESSGDKARVVIGGDWSEENSGDGGGNGGGGGGGDGQCIGRIFRIVLQ